MATEAEVVGNGIASQALAAAALEMLVRLGHKETLDEVRAFALQTLKDSLDAAPHIDHDAAMEAGRMTVFAAIQMALVRPSPERTTRQ